MTNQLACRSLKGPQVKETLLFSILSVIVNHFLYNYRDGKDSDPCGPVKKLDRVQIDGTCRGTDQCCYM